MGENEGTNDAPSSSMSTKRRRTGQSSRGISASFLASALASALASSRSGAAREPPSQQQLQLLDEIEKENAAVLDKLPREVWAKIVGSIGGENYFPFALTCRYFRDLHKDVHPSCSVKETNPLATFTYLSTHDYD